MSLGCACRRSSLRTARLRPEERSDVYYLALLVHLGCTAAATDFASWVGGDEIHFHGGAQVLGPAAEPSETVSHLVRRLADDRPLPERARLVARQLVGGRKQFGLAAAHLCEGGQLLAGACACATRSSTRSAR